MGLLPLHLMNNSQKMLGLISQRQEALADNIANMHTIGYKRKDVDFSQYLNTEEMTKFEAKIIDKYGPSPVMGTNTTGMPKAPEEELALMQENYLLYSVASKQLSATITEIKSALNVTAS